MRISKKWGLLLAGPLAGLGAMVPSTAAHASPGAAVCAVVGSVHLSSGVKVNPTESSSGTYTFASTVLACAGTVSGVATTNSSGSYADGLPLPTFSGSFSAGPFVGGAICGGNVTGPTGSGVRLGPVVVAELTGVTCSASSIPVLGGTSGGLGAVVLTFAPNPLTLNTCGGSTTDPTVCDSFMQGPAVLGGGS